MSGKKKRRRRVKRVVNQELNSNYLSCHRGDVLVFKLGETEIYGGGLIRGSTGRNMDLIIELHECRVPVATVPLHCLKMVSGVSTGRKARSAVKEPERLYLPIDDGTAPDWSREFWVTLMEDIQRFKRVLIRCLGGHGRTGTVLAILAGLSGIDYPCKYIREKYCDRAIEREVQKRYVKRITGCSGDCDNCIEVREFKGFGFLDGEVESRVGGEMDEWEYDWEGRWRDWDS